MISSNSLPKLDSLFQIFAEINTNYSTFSLPTILGKSLCGPDFNLRLEDYGYSASPAPNVIPIKKNNTNTTITRATLTPSPMSSTVTGIFNSIRSGRIMMKQTMQNIKAAPPSGT